MFELVRGLLKAFEAESESVSIVDIKDYGKKVEAVISSTSYMASISIVEDSSYDFLAVDIETEDIRINRTCTFSDTNKLIDCINEDLRTFSTLE